VKKGLPILEDVLGGFSVVITKDDGVSPVIDLGGVGRHTVSTGSSPQAVISALVTEPLSRLGMKILDVELYAAEMQNPDVTKPAGAGDVPLANYKMIGALAVMQGEIERSGLNQFITEHGLVGWAPTQGHIPSGVPLIGFAHERIMGGKLKNAMIIGKGSLFLGRMTSLFDGVSFLVRKNTGMESDGSEKAMAEFAFDVDEDRKPRIVVAGLGSELGEKVVVAACASVVSAEYDLYYLGQMSVLGAVNIMCTDEGACSAEMTRLLNSGECDAAIAMHHAFPIGTATVGRVVTPVNGKEMFIATTTGTPAAGTKTRLLLLAR
jgi:betaine reductase